MSLENAFSSSYSENSDTSQQAIELTIPFLEEDGFIDYRKILSESVWHLETDCFSLSSSQQEWLLHEGSLTQKLLEVATNFNVEVVQEKWIAKNSEKTTACNEDVWSREVLLKDGEKNWIFAQ